MTRPRLAGVPEEEWWRAVELGAAGRYGEAWAVLEPFAHGAGRIASLASSTLGSHHRQLGRHAVGREHDERALKQAADEESLVEALLGLTADAVGLGEPETARTWLTAARRARRDDALWRVRVRAEWVSAEVSLLAGEHEAARAPARRALQLAAAHGTDRHVAKSLLFVAVSDPAETVTALRTSWAISTSQHYETLVWPAGELLIDRAEDNEKAEIRERVLSAVRLISESLPKGIAQPWAAERRV